MSETQIGGHQGRRPVQSLPPGVPRTPGHRQPRAETLRESAGRAVGPSYGDLVAEWAVRHGRTATPNDRTALRRFMEVRGARDTDPVVPAMSHDFQRHLAEFEEALRLGTNGMRRLQAGSLPGYLSRMRAWHAVAADLIAKTALPTEFSAALAALVDRRVALNRGDTLTAVARRVGMFQATLYRWCTQPVCPHDTATNRARIEALERELGQPPGTLLSKVIWTSAGRPPADEADITQTDDGQPTARPSEHRKVRYRPNDRRIATTMPAIADFFERLERHKTVLLPGEDVAGRALKRTRRARWRKLAGKAATAGVLRAWFRPMLGWLMLPDSLEGAKEHVAQNLKAANGEPDARAVERLAVDFLGKGLKPERVLPILLVEPQLVSEFLDWYTQRGAVESGFHRHYLGFALSLLRRKTGFLSQQVEFACSYFGWEIGDLATDAGRDQYEHLSRRWAAISEEWCDRLDSMLESVHPDSKARDPALDLQPFLSLPDPLVPVLAMIRAHEASRPPGSLARGGPGAVRLAIWHRDQLLLRMPLANPLRNRNYREMTWRSDGSGNLYLAKDGRWRLRFAPSDFKNERGAAKKPYDVALPRSLNEHIESYIHEARPILLRSNDIDEVFVSQFGKPFDVFGLSSMMFRLTERALAVTGFAAKPFRTHAFRHLVATSWLKNHPGDYPTVALILHDKLETVIANYAHLSPSDGLDRYAKILDEMWAKGLI